MEERRQIDPLTYPPGQVRIEKGKGCVDRGGPAAGCGLCAICLEKIALQDMALVKGCEHAYCATCSLRRASYSEKPSCPRCKHPFEFLNILRSLDGSIHDCMFEESVCLLLRRSWFVPTTVGSLR